MATVLLWTSVVLDAGILIGLFVRGRWHQAYLLPVVMLAFLASATTVALCPRCNTWEFWIAKELVHVALTLLLGVELAVRLCPPGSTVRRHARVWMGIVVTAVGIVALTTRPGVDMLPRLAAVVIGLYAGLTLVRAAHDVTLYALLHETLLYSFPACFIVYVIAWGFTVEDTRVADFASPLAFDLVMLNLLRVVWRRDEHEEFPTTLRERLRNLRQKLWR